MAINFTISRSQTALVFIAHTRAGSEIIRAITQMENILGTFGGNLDFLPSCEMVTPSPLLWGRFLQEMQSTDKMSLPVSTYAVALRRCPDLDLHEVQLDVVQLVHSFRWHNIR